MKKILLSYGFVILLTFALLSVVSYGAGAGYVYILWHKLQIQTNLWVLIFSFILLSLIVQIVWWGIQRSLNREKRKLAQVLDLKNLHPYEQMAVIWLLNGDGEKQAFILDVFDQSGLLKRIMQSRLLFRQKKYTEALSVLDDSAANAFELAEIQRIEIYLALNDEQKALSHLEFLNGHALSPWLNEVSQSYQRRIQELWSAFAVQFPWMYLRSTQHGRLTVSAKQAWLVQLLNQFEIASYEDLLLLQQRYLMIENELSDMPYETKLLWLKLLSRMPEMSIQHEQLALLLLNEKFDQQAFYMWFQQQLLKQNPDYRIVEQNIEHFESKYASLPVLSFAKWHIYQATHREQDADQLLSLYPNDILMNYLRIKSTLKGNDALIQQLNLIFEKDVDYIQLKI